MTVLIVPMIYSLKPNAIEDCRRDSGGRAEWKDAVSKNPESTFIRSAGVSKQPSDFKRIDNAIMKCLATAFAIADRQRGARRDMLYTFEHGHIGRHIIET